MIQVAAGTNGPLNAGLSLGRSGEARWAGHHWWSSAQRVCVGQDRSVGNTPTGKLCGSFFLFFHFLFSNNFKFIHKLQERYKNSGIPLAKGPVHILLITPIMALWSSLIYEDCQGQFPYMRFHLLAVNVT